MSLIDGIEYYIMEYGINWSEIDSIVKSTLEAIERCSIHVEGAKIDV